MPFTDQYKRGRQPWETTTSKLEEREREKVRQQAKKDQQMQNFEKISSKRREKLRSSSQRRALYKEKLFIIEFGQGFTLIQGFEFHKSCRPKEAT